MAKVEMIRMTPERILCKDSSGNTTFDTNDRFLRQFSQGELVVGGTNIGTPIFYGLTNLGPFDIGGGWMSPTFGGSSYASGFSDWNYIEDNDIHPRLIQGNDTYVPAGEVRLISWFDINPQADSDPEPHDIGGWIVGNLGGNSWFRVGAKSKTNEFGQSKIPRPPGQQQWVSSTQYIYGNAGSYISYRWRFWYDPTVHLNGYYIRLEVINPTCTTGGGRLSINDFYVGDAGVPSYATLPNFTGWFGKFNLSYLVSRPPINLTAEVTV